MRHGSCLLLLVGLPGWLAGQAAPSVTGVVRAVGDSGPPIPGAEVLIGKRKVTTGPRGTFQVDGLSPGEHPITIRHIGFLALRSRIAVLASEPTVVEYYLTPAPVTLPDLVVEAGRTGIYGVVGDAVLQPVRGASVEVLGNRGGAVLTDSLGRFAFPAARPGAFLVRVTRPGYVERRIMVELASGKGRELGIRLTPGLGDPVSHAETAALFDLRRRLAFGLRREVMVGSDLARYGSLSVCDVPRIRMLIGRNEIGILNGETALLPGQICTWQMNEVGLIEVLQGKAQRGPMGVTRGSGTVIIWEKR